MKFGEKEVKNSGGSTISAKDVQDRGFKVMVLELQEKEGGYSATASFVAKDIMNSETAAAVDAYLNQVKPEGSRAEEGPGVFPGNLHGSLCFYQRGEGRSGSYPDLQRVLPGRPEH